MLLFRAFFLKKWYIGKFEKLDLGKKLQSSFLHSSEQPYTALKICAQDCYKTTSFYLLVLYFITGQRNVEGFFFI